MVDLTCGAVDLINQCTVTWNVSVYSIVYAYTYVHMTVMTITHIYVHCTIQPKNLKTTFFTYFMVFE